MDIIYLFIMIATAFMGSIVIWFMGATFTKTDNHKVKTLAMAITVLWQFVLVGILITAYSL